MSYFYDSCKVRTLHRLLSSSDSPNIDRKTVRLLLVNTGTGLMFCCSILVSCWFPTVRRSMLKFKLEEKGKVLKAYVCNCVVMRRRDNALCKLHSDLLPCCADILGIFRFCDRSYLVVTCRHCRYTHRVNTLRLLIRDCRSSYQHIGHSMHLKFDVIIKFVWFFRLIEKRKNRIFLKGTKASK